LRRLQKGGRTPASMRTPTCSLVPEIVIFDTAQAASFCVWNSPYKHNKKSVKIHTKFQNHTEKNPIYSEKFRNPISKLNNFENSPQTLLHNNNIRRNHSSP
jgi:hypothetical protein